MKKFIQNYLDNAMRTFTLFVVIVMALQAIVSAANPTITEAQTEATVTTPVISYLSIFPPVVVSRQYASLIWAIERGGGHAITFSCVTGIKIRRADSGAEIPCGVAYSASARATDDLMFSLANTSGVGKMLDITVTPKDGSGLSYSNAAKKVSLNVGPIVQPILSFEASSQVIQSASSTTFSWTADSDLSGVNFWFSCNSAIKATTSAQTTDGYYLKCNRPVLPSNMGVNGSATFTFFNESVKDEDITVQLLPSTGNDQNGTPEYDATRAPSLTISVKGSRPITPVIESLEVEHLGARLKVASSLVNEPFKILSGATSTLSWTGTIPFGSNLFFQCTQGIRSYVVATTSIAADTIASTTNALATLFTNQPIACDRPGLVENLGPGATTSLVAFVNETDIPRTVRVGILPARSNGELSQGQFISFYVFGKSVTALPGTAKSATAPSSAPKTQSVKPAPTKTPGTVGTGNGTTPNPAAITLNLKPGSRSNQVIILQKLLAKDSTLYPEAAVTGYFGPATERAVKRFQLKYRIHRKGDDGYGIVDKATRDMLVKTY